MLQAARIIGTLHIHLNPCWCVRHAAAVPSWADHPFFSKRNPSKSFLRRDRPIKLLWSRESVEAQQDLDRGNSLSHPHQTNFVTHKKLKQFFDTATHFQLSTDGQGWGMGYGVGLTHPL